MTVHDVARSLPGIPALKDLCRSIAMLETVLNPASEFRIHAFDREWSETEETALMDDGSGNDYAIVFSPAGAYIRGFDHESPMSPYVEDGPWPGVVDSVPVAFREYVTEPAFADEEMPRITACLWRGATDAHWHTGEIDFPDDNDDPDGSDWLFHLLTEGTPEAFRTWAEDYYETSVDLDAIRHVYAFRPLDGELIARLNPKTSLAEVSAEAARIGYPVDDKP
ncbi:hypothetical protein SRB5_29190 [Streptomyces sp. RB5]|uniref:Uncharacterized protein n=1 Tax=Streptomyces smaragdinus TaxID=2585196 RepID=A0A7K0CH29_9ACTN|nr:hypothetical protein [Streptomyces smaragdinus]MQY12780.1 hypothetical protein [Streptomyces smaragdinus]